MSCAIVLFRDDLRLGDHAPLVAASDHPHLIALYIHDTHATLRPLGGAAQWWLHHSLTALNKQLHARQQALVLRRGDAGTILLDLCAHYGVTHVYAHARTQQAERKRDEQLQQQLTSKGVTLKLIAPANLVDVHTHRTGSGDVFKVFTPFWKAAIAKGLHPQPLPAPQQLPPAPAAIDHDNLNAWSLLPTKPDWSVGLQQAWTVGEDAAHHRLDQFLQHGLRHYKDQRNRPDITHSTSKLSPHLRFGEISPRQIWQRVESFAAAHAVQAPQRDVEHFFSELGWREFSYYLLHHFPYLPTANWRKSFDQFPWQEDAASLKRWQKGQTGFPIIDAGMRELWHTGWMHNRVRMIAGSFLVKDLRQHWRSGEAWFWDTLVDADHANNAASWQWVAGSGADAAPYFRIFNPLLQAQKFDPNGDYVRRWVPELARLNSTLIHQPHTASPLELKSAGIVLDEHYPRPMLDHHHARDAALAAFKQMGSGDTP